MGNGRSRQLQPQDVIEQSLRQSLAPGVNLRALPIEQVMEEHTSLNYISDIVVVPGVFTVTHSGHLLMIETVLKMLEEMDPPRDPLCVIMPYGSPKHTYFLPGDADDPGWRLLPDALFDTRIQMLCAAMTTLRRPERVFVCNDMLGDTSGSASVMDAYELIRTMSAHRWPRAKIHCLCGSDSLEYVQQTFIKAASPKRTAANPKGQSIFCVDVDGHSVHSSRRQPSPQAGLAPGQSGEIGRSASTVDTLRVVSAVVQATIEEFEVPGLSKYNTQEICASFSRHDGIWESQLPPVIVTALKECRDAARDKPSTKRHSKKALRIGKKK